MNARQEHTLEDIKDILLDIRALLRGSDGATYGGSKRPPYRSGLNDLTTASIEHVAELEKVRREAERANGWAPDSELSWRDQFERLARDVRDYERQVDDNLATDADPRPSGRLPWNQERKADRERVRAVPETQDRRYGHESVEERTERTERTDPRRRPREGDLP